MIFNKIFRTLNFIIESIIFGILFIVLMFMRKKWDE